jgi:apolipoprotein N-acyltransferase
MPVYGLAYVWIVLFVALTSGNRGIVPVPDPTYFVVTLFIAIAFTLPFAADRLVIARHASAAWTLVFPLAFVAIEFLQARWSPSATWGSLAYGQYGNLPLMQLSALVGIWGISFVVAWFASTLEWAWSRGFEWSVVRTPLTVHAAALAAIMLGGGARLVLAPSDRPTLRMATLNRPVDLFAPGEMTRITEGRLDAGDRVRMAEKLARLHAWFLDGSRREARAGARLVAWPEQNLLVFAKDEAAFIQRARTLAAEEHVYLAIGMGTIHLDERLPFENKALLIDPDGRIVVSYLKNHPVFGWEASIMRRGDGRLPVVTTRDGRMSTAICFDADFPEFIRQAGQGDADLLILPANDARSFRTMHAQMAVFRAIENGVSIVRPAASGLSSAVDPWGRVVALSDYFAPGDRTMTAQVAVAGIPTLYARIGDLFAWLCVAGLAVSLALAR